MTTAVSPTSELQATIDRLLLLPPEQRLEVGELLIASVPWDIDESTLAEWERRMDELDQGSVIGIPAQKAIQSAREVLQEARTLPPEAVAEDEVVFSKEWDEEIARRLAALESGEAITIPVRQAIDELRKKYGIT